MVKVVYNGSKEFGFGLTDAGKAWVKEHMNEYVLSEKQKKIIESDDWLKFSIPSYFPRHMELLVDCVESCERFVSGSTLEIREIWGNMYRIEEDCNCCYEDVITPEEYDDWVVVE